MTQHQNKKRKSIKNDEEITSPLKKASLPRVPLKKQPSCSISVCIPSSIISHCVDLEQKTQCVYQVARALCIYNVGEVIVLDVSKLLLDVETASQEKTSVTTSVPQKKKIVFGDDDNVLASKKKDSQEPQNKTKSLLKNDVMLIASLLQYFITPPYLVKSSFTKEQLGLFHKAALLPKISTLPFMLNNSTQYKEGLSIPKKKTKKNLTKFINIGESKALEIDQEIPANVRVTVDVKNKKIVSPRELYGVVGLSAKFGYHVRLATDFNKVFTDSVISSGFTKAIYVNSGEFFTNQLLLADKFPLPAEISLDAEKDKLLLIVGEFKKLNDTFKLDDTLKELECFKQMCDFELDIVKGCRIEDGLLIALTRLQLML